MDFDTKRQGGSVTLMYLETRLHASQQVYTEQ